jgi:hypothetical protein
MEITKYTLFKDIMKELYSDWDGSFFFKGIDHCTIGGRQRLSGFQLTGHIKSLSRKPMRRVMVKDGNLDLDAVREKVNELREEVDRRNGYQQKVRDDMDERNKKAKALSLDLALPSYSLSLTSYGYELKLNSLTEEQVRAIAKVVVKPIDR